MFAPFSGPGLDRSRDTRRHAASLHKSMISQIRRSQAAVPSTRSRKLPSRSRAASGTSSMSYSASASAVRNRRCDVIAASRDVSVTAAPAPSVDTVMWQTRAAFPFFFDEPLAFFFAASPAATHSFFAAFFFRFFGRDTSSSSSLAYLLLSRRTRPDARVHSAASGASGAGPGRDPTPVTQCRPTTLPASPTGGPSTTAADDDEHTSVMSSSFSIADTQKKGPRDAAPPGAAAAPRGGGRCESLFLR